MRWSSPSWTTTPMSTPGGRWPRSAGSPSRSVRMRAETGQLDWDDLRRQVTGRTKVLAIGAASNALGTINDVARAAEIAREVGALSFVDAVHYAPHRLVDVRALGCDFMACSSYKFYGPHAGILFGRGELLRSLDVPKLRPSPDTAPERLETGTQNHEGIAGTAAAIDFLASLADGPRPPGPALGGLRRPPRAGLGPGRPALEPGLRRWDGVTLFGPGPAEPRTPTISFAFRGVAPVDVCRHLAARGIFASQRRLLRLDRRGSPGTRGGRPGPRRLCLLHHDRGGGASARGSAPSSESR